MKMSLLLFFRSLVISMLSALVSPPASAQDAMRPIPDELGLGPVYLSGRYACYLAEIEAGFIKVSTSSTGALSGSISLLGRTEDFTGSIRSNPKGVSLMLRGKLREGGVILRAKLVGANFIGTATVRGKKAPCRIDVTGVGPLRANYNLALATASNGRITGAGTLKVGQKNAPVTAAGRTSRGAVTLTIKEGKRPVLRIVDGKTEATGFTAKWIGQGFGGLTKGSSLRFAPPVP